MSTHNHKQRLIFINETGGKTDGLIMITRQAEKKPDGLIITIETGGKRAHRTFEPGRICREIYMDILLK